MSLLNELSNLHLLLRVPSFNKWPLQIRFFSEDVYRVWQTWSDRVDGKIRDGIKVVLDKQPPTPPMDEVGPASTHAKGKRKREAIGKGGIDGIDVGYAAVKPHLEKSMFMLAEGESNKCAGCSEILDTAVSIMAVCPATSCRAAFHIRCLASKFASGLDRSDDGLIPTEGSCPECKAELIWADLMKETTLRMRGEKEVSKLMKKSRECTSQSANANDYPQGSDAGQDTATPADDDEYDGKADGLSENEDEAEYDLDRTELVVECPSAIVGQQGQEHEDDTMSVSSTSSEISSAPISDHRVFSKHGIGPLEIVIEDSDSDHVEIWD
ncbi:Slx4p interacting protein [Bachmanniomyces sp. S44760]|nr:Slx4p interacting protein [Bachmanniomyces sp. S44760]